MQATAKSKLLKSTAALLTAVAVALAGLGFFLIKGGAYPAEGSGSLGHVGMVIAGAIAGFLAVVLGLFAVFCISRVRAVERAIRLENERQPECSVVPLGATTMSVVSVKPRRTTWAC